MQARTHASSCKHAPPCAQVRSGSVAERVGPEGVALQYAVDCRLDAALAEVWLKVRVGRGHRVTIFSFVLS